MEKPDTTNKWELILPLLGIETHEGKPGPCPICGGTNRFRFDNKEGRGTYYCNQCRPGDGWQLVQKTLGIDFKEAMMRVIEVMGEDMRTTPPPKPNNAEYILHKIYKGSKPLDGTDFASKYLRNRGLSTFPEVLRWKENLLEPDSGDYVPGMLATFSLADGTATTCQVTYLNLLGEKRKIAVPKRTMTPKYPMAGGAVRLFPPAKLMGVAEGVETALACHEMLNNVPVWATLSATMLEKFEPPMECETLIIFADNDGRTFTGQKAAYTLANRVYQKCQIEVMVPEEPGDFLEELTKSNGELVDFS